jgi:hypothetical protein
MPHVLRLLSVILIPRIRGPVARMPRILELPVFVLMQPTVKIRTQAKASLGTPIL